MKLTIGFRRGRRLATEAEIKKRNFSQPFKYGKLYSRHWKCDACYKVFQNEYRARSRRKKRKIRDKKIKRDKNGTTVWFIQFLNVLLYTL